MQRLCIYCGSSPGKGTVFIEAAEACGQLLAERGVGLVYGGGNVGLMGRLADAVLSAGGEVIGVIPHHLASKELAHARATQMLHVASMHERKQTMADLCDGFLALPGGIGTMDELFEVFTWLQLGLHRKPIGVLNVSGFFDPMLMLLERMVDERFLKPEHRELLFIDTDPTRLLDRMAAFTPPDTGKWLDTAAQDLR